MKAILLAGGRGTRLAPLTDTTPKPLVRVLDVPVIEYAVYALRALGIRQAALTTCYRAEDLKRVLGDTVHGVKLTYFHERTPLGTAGAVKAAESFLDEDFLVLSGDSVFDFDLSAARDFHRETGALATMVTSAREDVCEFGGVKANGQGRITAFSEKPSWQGVFSETVNTGIYFFKREVLEKIPAGVPCDFSKDLFPRLLGEGERLFAKTLSGYWCDIGSPDALYTCNMDALTGALKLPPLSRGRRIQTGQMPTFLGEGVRLSRSAHVEGCVIGAFSALEGAYLSRSVLGRGCRVGEGAYLSGALTADGVNVLAHACLEEGAVLGEGAHVCEGARVGEGTRVKTGERFCKQDVQKGGFSELFCAGTCVFDGSPRELQQNFFRLGQTCAARFFRGFLLTYSRGSLSARCFEAARFGASSMPARLLFAEAETLSSARFFAAALGICAAHVSSDEEGGRVTFTLIDENGLIPKEEEVRAFERAYSLNEACGEKTLGIPQDVTRALDGMYYAYLCKLLPPLHGRAVTLPKREGSALLCRALSDMGAKVSFGPTAKDGELFLDADEARLCADLYAESEHLADAEHLRALLMLNTKEKSDTLYARARLPQKLEEALSERGVEICYPEVYLPKCAPSVSRAAARQDAYLYDPQALLCAVLAFWEAKSRTLDTDILKKELKNVAPFALWRSEFTFPAQESARLFSLLYDRADKTEGGLTIKDVHGVSHLSPSYGRISILSEGVDTESAKEMCDRTEDTLKKLQETLRKQEKV